MEKKKPNTILILQSPIMLFDLIVINHYWQESNFFPGSQRHIFIRIS